ncbi:MAG: FHA domain-containing protein [Gammaproteobacteria bacterium]|nr:FHA domain-containing protein [Gammaproteobacteria bacterium]
MLDKLFSKPLELTVGEQTLSFISIADFEFCLSGRTSVPSSKITDLVKCSTKQLQTEAHTIKDIEKRFVAILSRSIENPPSINRSLKELDTSIFSQDHAWRFIIAALNDSGDEFDPFRRIALVKYMQYLSSRQEIIKYLYSEKKKPKAERQEKNGDGQEGDHFKDTLIFENTLFNPNSDDPKAHEFERMPKGESVTATLKSKERIIVMLSKHKCEIEANGQVFFIDQAGRKHVLDKGRNVIGRDASGTVVIDSGLRDVSRMHLVIENLGDNSLQLTDLSSHGTYIPSVLLEDHTC